MKVKFTATTGAHKTEEVIYFHLLKLEEALREIYFNDERINTYPEITAGRKSESGWAFDIEMDVETGTENMDFPTTKTVTYTDFQIIK